MSGHKYEELARWLRQSIQNGTYQTGQRLPSENELTQTTGYSRQTVRQAMALLENEGLTDRVRGSGTYVRSQVPSRRRTHNIAVVTTYIGEYIFPDILRGIDGVLSGNGYTQLLSATGNRVDRERQILEDLRQKPIDGLIVEGTKTALPNPNIDLYAYFDEQRIPVVFINGFYPDLTSPVYVVADDRAGGRLACERLLKQGHRRIAGVFKNDDIQGHRRYAGYLQALTEAGIPVDDDHVLWYATETRDDLILSQAQRLLEGCTAVVCYNDEAAMQLLRHPASDGVEVISFDHSTFAQLSSFYSLANPKEEIGRLAAEKLLHLLDGQSVESAVLPWRMPEDIPSLSVTNGNNTI